jgi:formamidopyrimidine-DNA glycosylase
LPELPEVEVVRRQLEPTWVGQTIAEVWTASPSYFFLTSPRILKRRLPGQLTVALERHGKYILARFDGGSRLLCHLGMTGQLTARALAPDPHVHLRLTLSSGEQISFRDVRKFGKVEFISEGSSSPRLDKLGPDALTIDADTFTARLQSRSLAIKTALLNQSILAGVGNIYADEALFASGIVPTRPARTISRAKLERLHSELNRILTASIQGGGSTINDYLKPDGALGGYQDWHQVYGKRGEACPLCGRSLRHRVLGGRSTHYCSHCQR